MRSPYLFSKRLDLDKKLPSNVHIIHPEDSINSYSIIDKSSLCLVYASNIATEISALGKPLIVGGEAYIKNKGIVTDPSSKIEYFELIEKLLNKPIIDKNKILRAKKYAYYFYFQRMITIDLLDKIELLLTDNHLRANIVENSQSICKNVYLSEGFNYLLNFFSKISK